MKLCDACRDGDLSLAQTAVSQGAGINDCKSYSVCGETPLMMSVVNNHPSITRYLLGCDNIDTNIATSEDYIVNSSGWTVLYCIQDKTPPDIIKTILDKSDTEVINKKNSDNRTPLMCAVFYGRMEVVRIFSEYPRFNWDKEELLKVAR